MFFGFLSSTQMGWLLVISVAVICTALVVKNQLEYNRRPMLVIMVGFFTLLFGIPGLIWWLVGNYANQVYPGEWLKNGILIAIVFIPMWIITRGMYRNWMRSRCCDASSDSGYLGYSYLNDSGPFGDGGRYS